MIHPSYSELIEAINTNTEDDDNTMLINSRYSLVLSLIHISYGRIFCMRFYQWQQ